MDNLGTVAVATISLAGTIIVGWFTFTAQRRKDDSAARNDLVRLQDEIETGLWKRLKSEIEGLQNQLKVAEERDRQRELAMRELETRVMALEQENESLRRENAALRAQNERGGRL
jgi:uncharacterized protein YlxW (UPF0749 family)